MSIETETWPYDIITLEYTARHDWQSDAATSQQLEALTRRGWQPPWGISKGVAHYVLGLPSPKMKAVLENRGRWRDGMTFTEAQSELEALALAEGWR